MPQVVSHDLYLIKYYYRLFIAWLSSKRSRRPLGIQFCPIGPVIGPGDWVQGPPLSPDAVRQRLSLMSHTQAQPVRMDNDVGRVY